ncbi:MAG: hypothetical protein RLZ57_882 [Actinomycetota bacterium]|jgi:prolipoprotein diacylglyceryl transferase
MDRKIPTPSISVIEIGPVTIHIYALCIIVGIGAAIFIAKSRYKNPEVISDLAFYAIPGGVIGARIYHVLTSPENYQGENWTNIFKIWEGGLGIWGAIAGGAIAVWFKSKKLNLDFTELADAIAPGLLIAQAIGRFGNWFNAELFGKPTQLPWGLAIPIQMRPVGFENFEYFHPTFLYEAICSFILAILIMRITFKPGGAFALYVFGYCCYRFLIEGLRIDPANLIFGIRVNQLVALVIGAAALTRFLKAIR